MIYEYRMSKKPVYNWKKRIKRGAFCLDGLRGGANNSPNQGGPWSPQGGTCTDRDFQSLSSFLSFCFVPEGRRVAGSTQSADLIQIPCKSMEVQGVTEFWMAGIHDGPTTGPGTCQLLDVPVHGIES